MGDDLGTGERIHEAAGIPSMTRSTRPLSYFDSHRRDINTAR